MIETNDIVKAAKQYIEKGYTVIPIRGKQPARFIEKEEEDGTIKKFSKGWEKSSIKVEEVEKIFNHKYLELANSVPINIGIHSSKNGLVDIDLDCPESRLLAQYYLPSTDCIFGRKTSLNSHRLYSSDKIEYSKYNYLIDPQDRETEVTILEIRPLNGQGKQTVVPPSIHLDTKEEIRYSKNGDPTKVSFPDLKEACNKLAVACLISVSLNSGTRQDLIIALSGTLAKIEWTKDEIISFIDPIIKNYDDVSDYRTRIQGIEQTFNKNESGKRVTGINKLKELLQDHVFQKLKLWLGITKIEFPVFESDNSILFRRTTAKGMSIERLTSFSIKPIKSIYVPEEGVYLDCILNTESGRELNVKFTPESFDSSAKFKRTLSRHGNEHTIYLGNDVQVQLIKEFISMLDKDEVLGSNISGFNKVKILGEEKTFFITEEGGLTYNEEVKAVEFSDNVSFINTLSQDCKLVTIATPYQEEIDAIKPYILDFNSSEIVQAVLGWTVACFFKDYFIYNPELGGFPILFISGSSGSGKSKTAKNIIHNIWGIESQLKSFIEQSNFTIVKYMGSSNNIPIVFDEAKLNKMSKFKKDVFSNLIRIAYDNSVANKGRQDQTMVNYTYKRPLVLCSETGLNESAHLDRTVFVNFSLIKSMHHSKSFKKLSSMDLSIIGKALVDYVLTSDEKIIKEKIQECFNNVPKPFEDRPKVCLCAISFGLKILGEILEMEISPKELFEKQGEHFYSDSHVAGTRISEVDKTITSWCLMAKYSGEQAQFGSYLHDTYLEEDEHYKIKDGKLNIHVPSVFPLFRKWDKTYEHSGDLLDQKTFIQQVKEEPYFVDNSVAIKMGKKTQRCLVLDINEIIKKGVELFHPWIDIEDE